MSELFLIRHAQASFGATNYDQLSDLGGRQSRWLGAYFLRLGIQFEQLIVGDMARHRQTCDAICEGMQCEGKSYQVLPGLNEYDFGELVQAFSKQSPDHPLLLDLQADRTNKQKHFRLLRVVLTAWGRSEITEVSETWDMFNARVQKAREQIQAQSLKGGRVLAIGSGGSNSAFMGQVLGVPAETVFNLNLQSKNTGINRYFFNKKTISLTGFNAVPHLETPDLMEYVTFG